MSGLPCASGSWCSGKSKHRRSYSPSFNQPAQEQASCNLQRSHCMAGEILVIERGRIPDQC